MFPTISGTTSSTRNSSGQFPNLLKKIGRSTDSFTPERSTTTIFRCISLLGMREGRFLLQGYCETRDHNRTSMYQRLTTYLPGTCLPTIPRAARQFLVKQGFPGLPENSAQDTKRQRLLPTTGLRVEKQKIQDYRTQKTTNHGKNTIKQKSAKIRRQKNNKAKNK